MKAPRARPRPLLCDLVVLLAAALLLPAPQQQRFVRSQGLDVSRAELLGGSELTAAEFLNFEDALSLSAQNLGGRGRGGRGGSGNLGGGAYRSSEEFLRLRTSLYYIGGSPRNWESLRDIKVTDNGRQVTLGEKLPVREQGVLCNSCVGQALASAIQMSLATRFRTWDETRFSNVFGVDPKNLTFDVDARSLYYCTQGGRTCRTGWDIPDALRETFQDEPRWLRHSKCISESLASRPTAGEEAIDDWSSICADASALREPGETTFGRQNVSKECFDIVDKVSDQGGKGPLYTCTYSSLSNFWQIQRHIRNHGSVITRINIPDDFEIFLNETAGNYSGYSQNPNNNANRELVWKPYDFNVTAKPAFGHAALIVGYDNEEYTWTILNSWGTSNTPGGTRTKGVTKDGTFKVRMGLLGVGTPEATYGVRCGPTKGGPLDPNKQTPWRMTRPKLWNIIQGSEDFSTGCLIAQTQLKNEDGLYQFMDFNGVGDGNSIDIVDFIQKFNAYRYVGYQPKIFSYKYAYRMTARQWYNVWKVVTNDTRALVEAVRQGCPQRPEPFDPRRPECTDSNRELYKPNATHPWPYLRCIFWAPNGTETYPVQCPPAHVVNPTTDFDTTINSINMNHFAECGKNGTVGCTLYYTDVDVTNFTVNAENVVIRAQLCNPAWPPFEEIYQYANVTNDPANPDPPLENPADTSSLNELLDSVDRLWRNGTFREPTPAGRRRQQQSKITFRNVTGCFTPNAEIKLVLNITKTTTPRVIDWYVKCENFQVVELRLRVRRNASVQAAVLHPNFGALANPLLRLSGLRRLNMTVYDASRLGDLTVLQNLESLSIYHVCASSPLPANLLPGLPKLTSLVLTADQDYANYRPDSTSLKCGWAGAVPEFWDNPSNIALLNLTGNQLSGGLPNTLIAKWKQLNQLLLGGNALSGRIPGFDAWTQGVDSDARIAEIDFSGNNFQGDFPNAWKAFRGRLGMLRLNNIAALTGCVPLDAQNVDLAGTILDVCNFDEEKQVEAVNKYFTATLGSGSAVPIEYRQLLDLTVAKLQALGTLVVEAPSSDYCGYAFVAESLGSAGSINVTVQKCTDLEYITAIDATYAGLNLTASVNLAKGLPRLSSFSCQRCDKNAGSRQGLPGALRAATSYLKRLVLTDCAIAGQLPPEWANWDSTIDFIDVAGNDQLNGAVPADWSNGLSRCLLNVTNTGITRCEAAGGLRVTPDLPGCLSDSTISELAALKSLYSNLTSLGAASAELNKWDFNNAFGPDEKNYCYWPGLECTDNAVSVVNLSALNIDLTYSRISWTFETIVGSMLPGLENITVLSFAGVGVNGFIPAELLLDFELLETLDISNNPRISDQLPDLLAGLTSLKYFWLSGCTDIRYWLPDAYAALTDLVEFRAAGTDLIGGIPAEWALLKNLRVLELSGSGISGTIPDLSVNPPQTAAALLAKVQAAAGPADGVTAAAASSKQAAAAKAATRIAAKLKVQQADDRPGMASLEELILQDNRLTGSVPAFLGKLLRLRVINLSGNSLQGPLPTFWSQLNQLQELCVSYNNVNGTLPRPYNRLSNLKKFDVAYNNITGSLPDIYVSLRKLERFDVSNNPIGGNVPTSWKNFGGRTYKLTCLSVFNTDLNLATLPDFTNAKRKGIKVRKTSSDPEC